MQKIDLKTFREASWNLYYKHDLYEDVLRLGLSHPKLRSATAPLACYNSGASTRLYYPENPFPFS